MNKSRESSLILTILATLLLVIGFYLLSTMTADAYDKVKPIKSEVVSTKAVQDRDILYDEGMGNGIKKEYCYIKTTQIVRIYGDMAGQPEHGIDLLKGEGLSYVVQDSKTTRNSSVKGSLKVRYGPLSVKVTVPINIFKRGGSAKKKANVDTVNRRAQKKGCYKLYGDIQYKVVTYTSYSRSDTRGMSKEKKKKIKWVYEAKYKPTTTTLYRDSSSLRYIGKYKGK